MCSGGATASISRPLSATTTGRGGCRGHPTGCWSSRRRWLWQSSYASGRRRIAGNSRASASAGDSCPAVFQCDGSVEDRRARPRVRIDGEIALPLELESTGRRRLRERRFHLAPANHFERVRVEVGERIATLVGRILGREQAVV